LGVGADNPILEKTVTKSEEEITGHFSWKKLLRKARAVEPMMIYLKGKHFLSGKNVLSLSFHL
jgi:hypothetical protein